ncbi:hypothetical protein SLS62_000513 [Diatrype stigma]|uniref:Rhodopsin domain-containing protein n=1 Tax=Diatrype stigma TaxID=117547 RepID=A0AAN9UZZ2_9PEZI
MAPRDVIFGVQILFLVVNSIVISLRLFVLSFFVKASVVMVLYRISAQNDKVRLMRRLLLFSIGTVAVSAIVVLVGTSLQCTPLSVSWGVGEGTCVDPTKMMILGYFWSFIDISSVWAYAIMPIAMLWKVQMSFRMKALSSALLGLGILVKYFDQVGKMSDLNDEASRGGNNIRLQIWSIIELGLAILAACLSALRPLLRFLTGLGSAQDSASGQMSGHYIMHPQGHELSTMDPKSPGAWSGTNKLKIPQPDQMIVNDSQEHILDHRRDVERQLSSSGGDTR